jgi:prepilin peptidase CpaA
MLPALVLACAVAIWFDVRERRIPNWLTAGALVVALSLRALSGADLVLPGLASFGLAFAFGFPFFLVGGLGGGDVKLMASLAAFLRPDQLVAAMLVMALTGAAMAVVAAARRGLLLQTLANVHLTVLTFDRGAFGSWKRPDELSAKRASRVSNPYALAITAGALAGWFL